MEINENQWTKKFKKSSKITIFKNFKNFRAEKHQETTQNTWKIHFRPSELIIINIQDPPKRGSLKKK